MIKMLTLKSETECDYENRLDAYLIIHFDDVE